MTFMFSEVYLISSVPLSNVLDTVFKMLVNNSKPDTIRMSHTVLFIGRVSNTLKRRNQVDCQISFILDMKF